MPVLSGGRPVGSLHIEADVLVIGGGPAGAWAALTAARAGARVVLADKGYLGTSGATAPSSTGTWFVPPGEGRHQAVERRWQRTAGLADQRWMLRCADTAYEKLVELSEEGYPFPSDEDGKLYIANLRGPDYMRFMRRRVLLAGVTVLDHHPALELLSDGNAACGAAGVDRQGNREWRVNAGAVVLATGGCAFFERILGATGLTGDGYLMAAEAGARLAGMEFTGKYTLAPYGTSLNKGLPYRWASFSHEDGSPVLAPDGRPLSNGIGPYEAELARALIAGPVYAKLDLAEGPLRRWLRDGQPNCFVPHDRAGIDPFTERFRVTLRAEGTVRGTGGIRLAGSDCATDVPGLYAAGDAASREIVAGATSGGGGVNASWAIASGCWSGEAAERHARRSAGRGQPRTAPLGTTGLRPASAPRGIADPKGIVRAVREEVVPLDGNYFRTSARLEASRKRLESLWRDARDHLYAEGLGRVRTREAASVLATARWSVSAALARAESRGMHRRTDLPAKSDVFLRSISVGGLDTVEVDAPRQASAVRVS